MSHSLVKQLNHIVFGTIGRLGLISADMRDELWHLVSRHGLDLDDLSQLED